MPSKPKVHRPAWHKTRQEWDKQRPNATDRGYNYRWQEARRVYLAQHPLCVHCQAEGIIKAANEVDHIIPHKGDPQLFWDVSNWQPLCKSHHSSKTATERG